MCKGNILNTSCLVINIDECLKTTESLLVEHLCVRAKAALIKAEFWIGGSVWLFNRPTCPLTPQRIFLTCSGECKSGRALTKPGMCCEENNILYLISAKTNLLTKIMGFFYNLLMFVHLQCSIKRKNEKLDKNSATHCPIIRQLHQLKIILSYCKVLLNRTIIFQNPKIQQHQNTNVTVMISSKCA